MPRQERRAGVMLGCAIIFSLVSVIDAWRYYDLWPASHRSGFQAVLQVRSVNFLASSALCKY